MPIKDRAETTGMIGASQENPMIMRAKIKIRLWYMSEKRDVTREFDAPPDQPRIVARDL